MFEKLVDWFIAYQIIMPEERKLYLYGLKQGIWLILSLLVSMIIGSFFKIFWQSLVFLVVFALFRIYAGGYHAKTQVRCFFSSTLSIAVCLFIVRALPELPLILCLMILLSGIILFSMAPVEDKNKPLNLQERRKYGNFVKIFSVFQSVLALLMLICGYTLVAKCVAVAMGFASWLVVLGWGLNQSKVYSGARK